MMMTFFNLRKVAGSLSIKAPTLLNGAIEMNVICPGFLRMVSRMKSTASGQPFCGSGKAEAHCACVSGLGAKVFGPAETGMPL
jgi:hypothetical protein